MCNPHSAWVLPGHRIVATPFVDSHDLLKTRHMSRQVDGPENFYGGRVNAVKVEHRPPKDDPASLDFTQYTWVVDEKAADIPHWFDSDKARSAMEAYLLGVDWQAAMVAAADDLHSEVRLTIAQHPDCPAEVLTNLADDPHWLVRRAVAENPNCPAEVLTKLADDRDREVRRSVAENPNCPVEVLTKLADDRDLIVRQMAQKRVAE